MKDMMQPLVSIRCLTYNHAPYIRQCLDGFVMQKTNFKFEAIVHDDASTDGTADIVREYATKYPDIIKPILETENQYSKHDGSLSRIMNAAVASSAKYIATCEGDDYWTDPYKLQKQVDIMEANEQVVAVVTACSVADANGNIVEKIRKYPVVKDNKSGMYNLHDFFRNQHQYPTLTVMYRLLSYKQITEMFDRCKSRFLGDWILWVCLHTQGDFYFMNEVTAAYRINPTSVTHTVNAVERWKDDFNIRRNLMRELPVEYHKYLKDDSQGYFKLGMAWRKQGEYIKLYICFLKSFLCNPNRFFRLLLRKEY